MSKLLLKIFDFIDDNLGAFILAIIIIDVFLQVLSRILPGNAISWTVEVGEMLLGAIIWLSISDGVKKGAHVCFDLIIRTFPLKLRKVMVIINNALFIFYLILLSVFTVQALEYYTRLGSKTTILEISMFWVRMPILIGCIMGILRLLIEEYLIITNKKEIKMSDSLASEGGV